MQKNLSTFSSLYGFLAILLGIIIYSLGAFLGFVRFIFKLEWITPFIEFLLWYSALPIILGLIFILITLPQVRLKKSFRKLLNKNEKEPSVVVGLTAYNDEESIGIAVEDFLSHPLVKHVIVIDNNSKDNTSAAAKNSGAEVFLETKQGYGECVLRTLKEISKCSEANICVLCEGDMTFRSSDIDKLLAYLPHADIVNGTRIVDTLQDGQTQVTVFMHYGNLFVAKLLELKYFGSASLTDVGTTYKAFRREDAGLIIDALDPKINLEFNAHLIESCLKKGLVYLEAPITFHSRVGVSKGGNVSNIKALRVGMRMIYGIIFGWESLKNDQ